MIMQSSLFESSVSFSRLQEMIYRIVARGLRPYRRRQALEQDAEQAPEMFFAGITANAADFAVPVDQYKRRRQPFGLNERQVRR
jgi:hypothetical protein